MLPVPLYSTRLVTFDFQSLISLNRFRIFKKKFKVFEKFYNFHSFTAPTFLLNFLQVGPLSQHQVHKKITSLPTTGSKIFEKVYKFPTRAPWNGHAGIVTGGGGGAGPPVKILAFLLRLIFFLQFKYCAPGCGRAPD